LLKNPSFDLNFEMMEIDCNKEKSFGATIQ
jgi:hypothetical protein